jgi:hypothetical protein
MGAIVEHGYGSGTGMDTFTLVAQRLPIRGHEETPSNGVVSGVARWGQSRQEGGEESWQVQGLKERIEEVR